MKAWLRLASAAAVLWILGCCVWALVEYLRLQPYGPATTHKPSPALFFRAGRVQTIYARHPALGEVAFPDTMTKPQIEQWMRRHIPLRAENRDAPVEWNVAEPDRRQNTTALPSRSPLF